VRRVASLLNNETYRIPFKLILAKLDIQVRPILPCIQMNVRTTNKERKMHNVAISPSLSKLVDQLISNTEYFYQHLLRNGCGEKYQGMFRVVLVPRYTLNNQTFNQFWTIYSVYFYPHKRMDYTLFKLHKDSDAIPLHLWREVIDCPVAMPAKEWDQLQSILTDVYKILHEDGIERVKRTITSAHGHFGYQVADISANFGEHWVQDAHQWALSHPKRRIIPKVMKRTLETFSTYCSSYSYK
jgi:hypothetical protein